MIYGAGDVRVEDVPDPVLRDPTAALVRVPRSCICGSDLWLYRSLPASGRGEGVPMGFPEFIRDITLTGGTPADR
ncbi:hypothetical protein [Streptosporangium roseum]|uniref:hypothetical protein n=1 Tax=Streptosporangium roseum TaxID=2001 RepID=UPI0004CD9598